MDPHEDTTARRPQIGDVVSFKHYGFLLSSRKPKLPTLYRVRTDVKWQDVVQSWKEQKTPPCTHLTPSLVVRHNNVIHSQHYNVLLR